MRYLFAVIGGVTLLLVVWSITDMLSGKAEAHPSLGVTGSVLVFVALAGVGVSLILRAFRHRVPANVIIGSKILGYGPLGAALLVSGFRSDYFGTGDRVVLLLVGSVVMLAAATLAYVLFRDRDE
jgi:hypothetical protein